MSDDTQQPPEPEAKKERKFSQKQYDFLIECSKKGKEGIEKWNQWREQHPDEKIFLENAYLEGAHLENTCLICAHLKNTDLRYAHLKNTDLIGAHLENAELGFAHLENAKLLESHIEGAGFRGAKLQKADFSRAIVDGETLIWGCEVDRKTKFEGVALGNMRIYPALRQLLEYNVRRMNWEEWYKWKDWDKIIPNEKRNWFCRHLRCPIRLFWKISDYGRSILRIFLVFLGFSFLFGAIYWVIPNLVTVNNVVGDIRGFIHALYFSVVTMTTLGFGDIAANPDNYAGQILLMIQVILGYVLLGALVTRFAVLFTAGGPAGKFADEKTFRDYVKQAHHWLLYKLKSGKKSKQPEQTKNDQQK